MALISCPQCEKQISDKAITCPKCSYVMQQSSQEASLDPVSLSQYRDIPFTQPQLIPMEIENDNPVSTSSHRDQMASILGAPSSAPLVTPSEPYGLEKPQKERFNPQTLSPQAELSTSYWPRNTKRMLMMSHWHHLTENFQHSPQAFYELLSQAIAQRQLENVVASRVVYKEGGLFSAKREYLQISRNEYTFEICGAPYGTGFFVSWRLGEIPSLFWMFVDLIPFIGEWLIQVFHPMTYFRIDTALMFQELVRSAVNEVIDQITSDKGLRALTEEERKPIMRDFFLRR